MGIELRLQLSMAGDVLVGEAKIGIKNHVKEILKAEVGCERMT